MPFSSVPVVSYGRDLTSNARNHLATMSTKPCACTLQTRSLRCLTKSVCSHITPVVAGQLQVVDWFFDSNLFKQIFKHPVRDVVCPTRCCFNHKPHPLSHNCSTHYNYICPTPRLFTKTLWEVDLCKTRNSACLIFPYLMCEPYNIPFFHIIIL